MSEPWTRAQLPRRLLAPSDPIDRPGRRDIDGRPIGDSLLQVGTRVVEQTARDDQPLDLAGAFIDIRNTAIAHPLLDQMFSRDAHGTEDLDAAL